MGRFLLFLLTAIALAQAPIQVTTRLVQVAVVVRDKHGAVGDLTKADFEIFDKGKPRDIASFHMSRASDRVARVPLPPNTFSNRLNQEADAPVAATVILFDSLNTAFSDQAYARQQMLTLLKSIDPASPVAIYALGNTLRILHDFTGDPTRLQRALESYRTTPSRLLTELRADSQANINGDPNGSGLLTQILAPVQAFSTDRRVALTLAALQSIANRMAGVPGRKNLIWVSGGFPLTLSFDQQGLAGQSFTSNYAGAMKDAAIAIDRANVAIYPVDARGLRASAGTSQPTRSPRTQAGPGGVYMPPPEALTGSLEIQTMQLLADWTGGRAFFNTNDIQGAVARAMEDAEVTYTVGFYADEKDLDGSYHEVRVKVARKGAETRYRKGYFASAVATPTSQSAVAILQNAIASPADSTGIGLDASLAPSQATPGSFVVSLNTDLENLGLEAQNGRWTDDLNIAILQVSATSAVLESKVRTMRINVTDQNRDRLRKEGVTLTFTVTPVPGVSQIRVAVEDQATGNVGALRFLPLQQP